MLFVSFAWTLFWCCWFPLDIAVALGVVQFILGEILLGGYKWISKSKRAWD